MTPDERQAAILVRARTSGRVEVAELSEVFAVTPETIRHDLGALEDQGLLRRVRGGAIVVDLFGFEPTAGNRADCRLPESRMARAALEHLPSQGWVFLDAEIPTARLAELIPDDVELGVVTNSLPIAAILASRPGISLHLVGGVVRGRTLATVECPLLPYPSAIGIDVAFLTATAISVEDGVTTQDRAAATIKRAAVAAARSTVVLAEHTTFGPARFAHVARLSEIDVVITDVGLPLETARRVEACGPELVRT